MKQIKSFHDLLYSTDSKVKQDTVILKCCHGEKPKKTDRNKRRNDSIFITYKVPDGEGNFVRLCKNAFLEVTGLSRFRIERVVKLFLHKGEIPRERRGGDRVGNRNIDKKNKIKIFVESLKCVESHYCRSKTSERMYLPCELNFKKLYSIYSSKTEENHRVKLNYFREYVNINYNIGFGSPKTDVCSTCLRTDEKMKTTLTEEEKQNLITEQRVHKLKAKAFFKLLKTEYPNVQNFSFDCQKNLALPKLPDQACYFSQQLNYYNFTIVSGTSKGSLDPSHVFSYLWLETEASKDSNAIASAVHDFLKKFQFKETTEVVRLFADGCGGQNKNVTMMAMLSSWLLRDAPQTVKAIEMVFPIVGHSFMPPDRVFGVIEKHLKKKATIINPKEYDDIIKNNATVRNTDQWNIFDWRKEAAKFIRLPGTWHFQFNKTKRFVFNRSGKDNIVIRGEPNYFIDIGVFKGVCKRAKKISFLAPKAIPFGRNLKGDKSSIGKLLTSHFGVDWKENVELALYKNFLYPPPQNGNQTAYDSNSEIDPEEECSNQQYVDLEL